MLAQPSRLFLGAAAVLLVSASAQAAEPSAAPTADPTQSVDAGPAASVDPSTLTAWTPKWTTFSPADEAFTIRMPGLVTELETRVRTTTGTVPYTLAMVMRPEGLSGYVVSWAQYPTGSTASLSRPAEQMLLAAYQASDVAGIADATLEQQQQVTIGEYEGRTWTVSYPGGTTETHAYLVRDRLYSLKAVTEPTDDPAIAKEFFDSFMPFP